MEYNKICYQETNSKLPNPNTFKSFPIPIPSINQLPHIQYKNYQIENDIDIYPNSNNSNTINNSINSNNYEQYSLHLNNFNPSNMSPPNLWKIRLQSRIETHYNKSLFS